MVADKPKVWEETREFKANACRKISHHFGATPDRLMGLTVRRFTGETDDEGESLFEEDANAHELEDGALLRATVYYYEYDDPRSRPFMTRENPIFELGFEGSDGVDRWTFQQGSYPGEFQRLFQKRTTERMSLASDWKFTREVTSNVRIVKWTEDAERTFSLFVHPQIRHALEVWFDMLRERGINIDDPSPLVSL